jgi:hypothetical protein
MDTDAAAIAWTRTALTLPGESGQRFPEEWKIVERRVETVHGTPVSHEIEPAGAPRLAGSDE